MIAVDFFCGAGGASIGLAAAGYKVSGYDNWDVAVATHNAGGLIAHLHDLSNATLDECLPVFPHVAWFSPPCPPFSAAGKGEGYIDPRDGFPWALRIIRETRPWVVFIENVKGLTSKRHIGYLESVMSALRTFGYVAEWRVLNAADYGVPQTRQRVFIVARRDHRPICWPEATHAKASDTLPRWASMAEALGWGMTERPFPTVAGCNTSGGPDSWGVGGSGARQRLVTERDEGRWVMGKVMGKGMVERGGDRPPRQPDEPSFTIRAEGGGSAPGGVVWLNTGRDWKPGGDRDDAQCIALDDPAPTVTAISGQQWQVRSADRVIRLTLNELALLQDFPKDWPWQGNKTHTYRQVGNACNPTVVRLLAEVNR